MAEMVIPEALADEDGERWFCEGHVSPEMMVLAVLLDYLTNIGPDETVDLFLGGKHDPVSWTSQQQVDSANECLRWVRHSWMRPIDDERSEPCTPGDENAEPWTEFRINAPWLAS